MTVFCPICENKLRLVGKKIFVNYIEIMTVHQLITYDCVDCDTIAMVKKKGKEILSIEYFVNKDDYYEKTQLPDPNEY